MYQSFVSWLPRWCAGGWLLGGLVGSTPAAAQELRPRTLPVRPSWLTAAAIGPTLPVGPVRGPAGNGFDLVTTLESGLTHQKSWTSFLAREGIFGSKARLLQLVVKRHQMPQKHLFNFDA